MNKAYLKVSIAIFVLNLLMIAFWIHVDSPFWAGWNCAFIFPTGKELLKYA